MLQVIGSRQGFEVEILRSSQCFYIRMVQGIGDSNIKSVASGGMRDVRATKHREAWKCHCAAVQKILCKLRIVAPGIFNVPAAECATESAFGI